MPVLSTARTVFISLTVALLDCGVAAGAQPAHPDSLAAQLADPSLEVRANAIVSIMKTPREERGADVLPALLQHLDWQKKRLEERRAASLAGNPFPPNHAEGELLLDVLGVVAEYQDDERILPYALAFLSVGAPLRNIVARNGERTVDQVLEIASSSSRPLEDVDAALLTLALMLRNEPRYPLSPASRARISAVAAARLSGTQAPTVIMQAVELAAATGDPALREKVRRLSVDPGAIRAMGVEESFSALVRSRAAAALQKWH
jgi:hypothetical protein